MGTRIKTRITPKIRVMSFVLAFVILVVSLPIWIGNTGTKVKAADLTGDGNHIYSDTKTTTMTAMGNGQTSANDNRFVYTGKITKAQTELFDYVSDYELINNSYNNILHTEGGYDDEYTHLNQAISQSNNATGVTPKYAQSENITINYTPHSTTFSGHSIFMHCWRDGGTGSTTFPGIEMVYDTANSRYTCTFNPAFFGFSASAEPNRFIFSDNNGVQTGEYSKSTTKNNTYSFVTGETKIRFIAQEDQNIINSVQVYMWDNEGHENAPWPGVNMSFVGTNGAGEEVYEYTVSGISFRPRDFKFSINNKSWETGNAGSVIDMGYTYNCYYYQAHNNDKPPISVPAGSFGASSTASGPESGSKPIYDTLYTNPLYFGCFWRSNSADTIASNSNNPGYNISNKAAYNNFWWQANIGLKNTGTTANDNPSETDPTGFRVRGTASTQGLVHSSLVNDNLADPVNTTTELPYFDKTSSLVTSGLMKYYDKDETGDNIHFPFYEVRSDAATNVGSGTNQLAGTYQAYTGTGAVTQYAKFYQFDSKESNVRFEIAQNESNVEDPSLHKGHFVETTQAITHDGKAGYFPFNNINTNNEKKHNLGVGTKFEMTFKLQPDGCVGVVDSSGNDLDTNDYKTRVHTIFEFEGDDDLWVFIDGNLVLDMGGAHFKSHGVIDFANQTATVDKAITIGDHRAGYTGNYKDDLGVDYTSNAQISNTTPSTDYFKNRLKSGSFRTVTLEGGGTREEYDPTVSHKITVFYMERGMLDSNLLVRFNYTPESNFSKMKIAEVTDYSAINTGLQPFFQEAAENDVFMYTVENKGTKKADVLTNSAAYPTNENRTRKNEGENTVQEKLAVYDSNANPGPILYTSPGHVDPNDSTKWIDDTDQWSNVSGTSYLWVDGFTYNDSNASASKLVGKTSGTGNPNGTNTGGELFLMYGTCNNLYPPAGTEKEGKESSAEFEKTFTRDSIMKITQSNDLHKPTRTVSDGVLQVENFQTDSGRDVDQYYTTAVRLVDRDSHVNATLLDSNEDPITTLNPTLVNGGKFKFNNASSVDATSSVMLTEYFVNTPKMGAITIKKELDEDQSDDPDLVGEFTFKLYLENVFGINGVNVVNSTAKDKGYNKIDVTRLDKNNNSSTYTNYKMTATDGENYGEFKLKAGETLTINNIPYNTRYCIVEVSSTHAPKTPDTQYTTGNVLEGTLNNNKSAKLNASTGNYDENTANNATVVNTRLTGELKFQKTLGTYAAENGITGSSGFVYHVVLTAPLGVDLTEYISSSDVAALDVSGNLQSGTCTFNVTVTADDNPLKSLSGVPYGTTYTVEEYRTGNAANVTSVENEVTTAATLDKSNASPTVNITNNYPAPVHNLKIKEVTDFKDVNEGLLKLTKQAADSDVFQYTIKNKGTVNGDVLGSDIQTPTYDYYTRTNDDADTTQTTKLTGKIMAPVALDISKNTDFATDGNHVARDIVAWAWRVADDSTAYGGKVSEGGPGVCLPTIVGNVYYFTTVPEDANRVIFCRCSANVHPSAGDNWPGVSNQATPTNNEFVQGDIFELNSGSYSDVTLVSHKYSNNNFLDSVPSADANTTYNVANTNYIWKEAYANKVVGNNDQDDDAIDDTLFGMTNTTTNMGNFWLMYGTKYVENVTTEKESSAEFIKQFKVDNDNPSVMTVTQNGTLSAPSHPTTSPAEFAAGSRNVSTYYDTDVTATDVSGRNIDFTTNSGGNTVFNYTNSTATINESPLAAVRITETFTNTVNVGAITVQKKILKPGSDPAEYLDEDTATFTFRVQLKKVFGVSGLNVGTTNSPYTDVSATKLKSDSNEDTDFTGMTQVSNSGEYYGQFTLKNGEKLTISGIPVGTEYKITETATSDSNYQQNSTTMSDFETVTKGTLTNGISSVVGNNETIVNVRQTGTLKLAKSLGDFAAINGKTVGTPFKFNVTLTVPEGVDLTDYISDLKSFGDYNHTDGTQIYSFSKTVYDNGSTVDISGIPYGTTFLVSEDSESSAGTVSTPSEVSEPNSDPANTIDEAETTVTITNNYPAILNLQKAVTGDAPILSETFTFNVKLTGLTGTPTIKKVVTDENSVTTETVIDNPADFDVDIKSTDTVKITGIPKNTTYTVSEPDQPENWSIDNSNSTGLTGTFDNAAITTIPTAKITNTYTKPRKILTLQKVDSSRNNALVTFSDASKGAQFVLMRLSKTLNEETLDWTDSSTLSAFETVINADSYTPTTGDYVAMVYDNSGSNYSTGTSGQFDITESASFEFEDYYYFFYEVTAPNGYQKNNSVTGKVFQVVEQETVVAYPNMPDFKDVTAKKEDQDTGTGLPGAEFDLYYKPDAKRTTYTINESETSPKLMASTSLNTKNIEPTDVHNETTITTPKYNYTAAEGPSASESSWILPRTDNDYIFFRDYEPGTADHDPGLDKHAWLWTDFETNVYGQQKEIKYDHSYWYAAQFSGSGKSTVQYAVWERFVDRYDGKDTIIWKIQPPDGYTKVRFLLYHNNDCIRTTKEFTYKLGKLYTKTSWGGIYSNGNYYEVPVAESNWSTYYTASKTTNGNSSTKDKRLDSTTSLYQADRYVATPQKVVFHCNCKTVWHNIHIEFFSDSAGEHPVGQAFPGYMMEPYAYANNEYRISGYLTYELTIPDGANYFRINDGVTNGGTYGYYTKITRLYNENNNPLIEGKRAMEYKNYHNYFKIDSGDVNNTQNLKLKTWSNSFIKSVGDDPNKIYSDNNAIESDYDYVYFAAPSTWGNHIYAYFYGGGNLREDNWQRACYSIWPGVEPVGTEYKADEAGTDDVEHHSDIYTYSYTGGLYGGTTSATPTNPDSTFAWGDYTVYKFRVPLGDRTNYSKVIFNNGLSKWEGGKETGVITYHSGYLYKKNGSSEKFYDEKPTYVYTGRGDNLYVRINGTDFTTSGTDLYNWDDLHVVFYYSNNQAIQGGKGYVMKYSGTKDGYTYYSVPIPENAVSFTVNNGKNKSGPHNKGISTKYEILPLDETGNENLTQTFTKGNMVYTLASDTLTKTAPLFSDAGSTETISSDTPNPSPRGDYIYIKDENGSTLSTTPPTFTFYDSNNNILTSPNVNTHEPDGSVKWYSVGIPLNATKFKINGGSAEYPIYEKKAEGTSDNFTPGGMYYKALTNQTLEILWPTFTTTTGATNNTDDSWGSNARGDALYLVCDDVSDWYNGTDTIMTVTFYNESGQAIKNGTKSDIKANYIGDLTSANPGVSGSSTSVEDAVGSWFKVNIPKDAVSFEVKYSGSPNKTTVKGDIYEKRNKTSSYRNDYTLGDMQYRILNTQTGGKYDLERFYPLFNESETYTLEVSDSKTIDSSAGITLVDEEEVEPYIDAAVATPVVTENGTTDSLVLHATSSNTITYTWQEGGTADPNYVMLCDPENKGGNTSWKAYLWSSSSDGQVVSCDTSYETDSNGHKVYKFDITNINKSNIIFTTKPNAGGSGDWGSGYQSADLDISSYNNGHGYTYTLPWTETLSSTDYISAGSYVYFKKPNPNAYANPYSSAGWNTLRVEFSNSSTSETYYMNDSRISNAGSLKKSDNTSISGSFWKVYFDPDKKWTKVQFYDGDYGATVGTSTRQARSQQKSLYNYLGGTNDTGKMNYFEITIPSGGISNGENTTTGPIQVFEYTNKLTHDASWYESVSQKIYSSQFQPEDRYGYIGTTSNMYDTNGTGNTTNNFVKVVDEYDDNGTTKHYLTDPHILFYSNNGTTPINTNVTGTSQNNYGIKLNPDTTPASYPNIDGTKYTAYGNGTTATPYLIRLPKNAKYAKIFDGNTLVGSIVALTDSDGKTGGITLTVTKPESDKIVTATHPDRGSAEIQTAQKKTDIDYIYFTDVNSTMGSGIRAYYFGDTAGEFSPWPGVAPSYSYTDNSGNTVYVFQPPTITGNTAKSYPYVMFNNGLAYGTAKMTEAKPYTSAGNYKLDSNTVQYGTTVPQAQTYKLTKAQSGEAKTSSPTVDFNSTNTNGKYIFFVDNGPKNLTTAGLAGIHTPLDDVHIIFYSDEAGTSVVGTANGYVMDNLAQTYTKKDENNNPVANATGGTVYRMTIPNEAKYFKITNGVGKGTGTSVNDRSSVVTKIAPNGLYKFVDSTTIIDKENNTTPSSVSDYWNSGDTPAAASNLNDHQYYLELINEREPEEEEDDAVLQEENEIHLATIVTGANGTQDYIKWLKLNNEGTEVDWRYLDHTIEDIGQSAGVKTVKVVKTGSYYWVESKAPNGYEPDETPTHPFTVTGNESTAVSEKIRNKKSDTPTNKITLTKTAKEKVGDTDIGSLLGNAQFLLYVNDGDNDDANDTLAGAFSLADGEYTYGSGTVNTGTNYLITGNDDSDTNHYGKLVLKGLPAGDYYFKEINAPDDYSATDSNTGTNRRVYFSIGDNTVEKEISCTDEMDAAYIRLFEHISEKKAAWGDPTFIFKITNIDTGKTNLVSLTVNDDGTIADTTNHKVLKWIDSGTEQPFTADPINDTLYKNWLVEATSETEYKGMYHIDSQGRIRVEPGEYSITRVPVSRYEFVTSGNLVYTTDTEPTGTYTVNSSGTETAETVTLTAGQTGDIHYYDKVGYYDKFSQVDEEVNRFYKLESGANKTIKGIRIADYHSTATSGELALTGSDLTVYAIYADGTEGELNSTEKAKITFSYTDVDDEPAPFTPTLSSDSKTLTISDVTTYTGNVYTITATYPYDSNTNFTAKFDLVFSRT